MDVFGVEKGRKVLPLLLKLNNGGGGGLVAAWWGGGGVVAGWWWCWKLENTTQIVYLPYLPTYLPIPSLEPTLNDGEDRMENISNQSPSTKKRGKMLQEDSRRRRRHVHDNDEAPLMNLFYT